ncbi:MAG TPA: peptidyl-prolyl cis-trans isomerase [Thermoanaerobaculaceae bacterium]|nr:peptidyl-prolyl cis-trans isomerase [Thermoanaerobaculaceae bacterium]
MRSFAMVVILAALAASTALSATPVLRVNGDQITDVDLKLAERAMSAQMHGMGGSDALLFRQTVDQMINVTLLMQAARDAKVAVDPKEVAAAIDQQRQQSGGAEGFSKALAQAGLTEQDLTRMAEQRLMIQKYIETQVGTTATPTEQELREYYDKNPDEFKHDQQVKLRMMMFQIPQGADKTQQDAAKARAEAARKRVLDGEDFGKVAQETSDHPNKANGGQLGGWVREAALPEFESKLKGVPVAGVSEILQNQFGYFVFKVDDRRAAGTSSYDEVKDGLATFLKGRKADDSIRLIISSRRAKAKIEPLTPEVKAALEPPQPAAEPSASAAAKTPAAQPKAVANPTPSAPPKP